MLRFWTNSCPCWLDAMYQLRSTMSPMRRSLELVINAGMLLATRNRLIFGAPFIALWLTGKNLSAVKCKLIKPTRSPTVSLITETWMFLWMTTPLISGDSLLSQRRLVWICYCLCLLVGVVDRCETRLIRLFCCRIILTACSPESLLICHSLAIHLQVLPPLPSGRLRLGVSCYIGP